MRAVLKSFSKTAGLFAAVAALAVPAVAVLTPPAPESAVAAVASTAPQASSLASLLTGSNLETEQRATISPVGAMLMASAVGHPGPAAPYYYFGDINSDGKTNLADFLILKFNFGLVGPAAVRATGDLDGDFIVDFEDFLIVKFFFGASSPYSI